MSGSILSVGASCRARSGLISTILASVVFGASAPGSLAQVVAVEDSASRIEAVDVTILNPGADAALNTRIIDLIRRELQAFPGGTFSRAAAEIALARVRRTSPVTETTVNVTPGATGGVIVTIEAILSDERSVAAERGYMLTGDRSDLPVLYDRNGTYIVGKLELLTMAYANDNAWYGRPDLFLNGNPLVSGDPAGAGTDAWVEGFVHAGIYGITPLGGSAHLYGGLSGILSGSTGTELFTDETRLHFGIEDAYIGVVGGDTSAEGNRLVWNVTAGRKRFAIGEGFLIANSASNGHDRAALQSNPRWAADMLVLGQVRYNETLVEAFYLDPDELPIVDSRTKIAGLNAETRLEGGWQLGGTYLKVLESDFGYFSTTPPDPATATLGRDGLEVFDMRFRWQPELSGLFVVGEAAVQRNDRFDMKAAGIMGEVGYSFADATWHPTVSYRLARFSGDDPDTARFERWDPLLSGGNGEQWVQGINHFKVFQDSNLIAHRLQFRLRPSPKVELVPQIWLFKADSTTNIGGNPALSFLGGADLATEVNLTAKWFISKNTMLQAHVAATFPSSDLDTASGVTGDIDPWVSAMVFLRVAF
ncbi:alginate export family protein [Tabrizicola sp. BL-A-41-H6]|uniref:alginate export family protein n=1 Tax=Tabrizicola sp. BL-A-41-H6 TaxID=3421107 RepID=UPI003D664E71